MILLLLVVLVDDCVSVSIIYDVLSILLLLFLLFLVVFSVVVLLVVGGLVRYSLRLIGGLIEISSTSILSNFCLVEYVMYY